ncbi:MAG: hypothetical protein ACPGRX_08260 [Bdellovibrionales bacterium]
MNKEDREFLIYCLNEMMEGHFRVMRALHHCMERLKKDGDGET